MNEFDLIQRFFSGQNQSADVNAGIDIGIGDDAAVITPPTGQKLITCCDTLISDVHFPKTTSAFAIGYKAVAVNLSDLAAMGATPHSILLALSLPEQLKADANWLSEFAKGLFHCCQAFEVQLVGGDTTKSELLTITVTAFGFAKRCLYRSGAQVGDLIAVSGTLGDAAFALQDLLAGKPNVLQHRLDMPTPRIALGQQLSGIATSMIDISDGLLQDLGHICKQSGVLAHLDLEKLPTHDILHTLNANERLTYQLSGGDDYELLFTFPKHKLKDVTACHLPTPVTVIGKVVETSDEPCEQTKSKPSCPVALFYKNQPYAYNGAGYQHF